MDSLIEAIIDVIVWCVAEVVAGLFGIKGLIVLAALVVGLVFWGTREIPAPEHPKEPEIEKVEADG